MATSRQNVFTFLKLDRPLAVFDLEATGISPRADRIVDIAVLKLTTDTKQISWQSHINPQMPIPPDSTRIHGITDADVAQSPTFPAVAEEVRNLLQDCDLCGYNITRFDVPMLQEEFLRAGIKFDIDARRIVDVQRIYHRREPRDLSAALAFYCGEMHLDAHGAQGDVLATLRVLEGQFQRYSDLPHSVAELHEYCNLRDPSWADRTGRLKWENSEIVINFGRKKGESLRFLIQEDPNFIKWLLKSDFPNDMREIVQNAQGNKWPKPPAPIG